MAVTRDQVWIVLAAILAVVLLWPRSLGVFPPAIAGLALVLFLPGFLLYRVFHPERRLTFEVLVLVSGLSIALTVVSGLLLHAFGALNNSGWAIALTGISALLLLRLSDSPVLEVPLNVASVKLWSRRLFLPVACAAAALAIARDGALHHRQFDYTQLWMLPSATGQLDVVTLGVKNAEKQRTRYSIDFLVNSRLVSQFGFDLAPDEEMVRTVSLAEQAQPATRVEAWLYKEPDRSFLYRKVVMNAPDATPDGSPEPEADPASDAKQGAP